MLLAILHYVPDLDEARQVVSRLTKAVPAGSYLVMSHGTYDPLPPEMIARCEEVNAVIDAPWRPRSREELARFFDGMELVDPGIVSIGSWRPAKWSVVPAPQAVITYGAVARIG